MYLTKNRLVEFIPGTPAIPSIPSYTVCTPPSGGGGGHGGGGHGGGGANCRTVCVPVTRDPGSLDLGTGPINGQRCDVVCG